MSITVIFFLGLLIALIGVIPPGLLNMTAAKISLKDGHPSAIVFSLGVCLVVFLQTYIAAMFARYMTNHQDVVEILQRVAFVIFVLITIYFLCVAKGDAQPDVEPHARSKHSRFFQGIFLSAINVFPIPYQAYMTITIASFGWFVFDTTSIVTYCSGATTGTFVMLYMYMFFFDKIKARKLTSQRNMNRMIGAITCIIAIVTFINILMEL
ncbi:lysine transporter LysE [Subsaximicrobium wynnwilliamsii]|uniref:Lysine transporter LysE n=1 Tax=Subsaximicrobium wynnwilliamsii TaxID=291179 RepID=A0A5C6ZDW4_9FLAO|nr:LysE family transporter [Subsaximicrobium wynnwilliamsii]TXD82567.1 lysine transporter LysE [Subsaximicrobium wynnwilliamsii]TXD88210.1 lysine transporter LysE [Subsaximicrobium wynnwilliamsii]TXE02225.1 lysine transporter LysE [Subsaximicrobium wynnwilliamsii]